MPIKKESLKALLKSLHYTDDEIATYVDGEDETEISLKPDVKVFTDAGLSTMKENVKNGALTAGMEIAIKNLKEKTGLDFEGKDPDEFINHFSEKVKSESNIKPAELTTRYEAEKKALQQKVLDEQAKYNQLQAQLNEVNTEKSMLAAFPKGERIMSDNDLLLLAKAKVQPKQVGDKTIYTYNGMEMKDDTENYLSLDAVLSHVFTSEKWVKPADPEKPKGAGFKDGTGTTNGYKSMAEIRNAMDKKGINPLTPEGREFISEAVKANPEAATK